MSKTSLSEKSKRGQWSVILHNDNHHTFDEVTDALMDVCGHAYLQAVQCGLIVHQSKRCSIFTDTYTECEHVYKNLRKLGLKVDIEKCVGSAK